MGYHILCDEHGEPETVDLLEDAGHDAVHVQGVLELGVDDSVLSEWARERDYAILTNDRGFLKKRTTRGSRCSATRITGHLRTNSQR